MLWLVLSIALAVLSQACNLIPSPGGVAVWVLLWAPFELSGWRGGGVVVGLALAGGLLLLAR